MADAFSFSKTSIVLVTVLCFSIILLLNDVTMNKHTTQSRNMKWQEIKHVTKSKRSILGKILIEKIKHDGSVSRPLNERNETKQNAENEWEDRNGLNEEDRETNSLKILESVSQKCSDERFLVPNIVHYIWFGCSREFDFYNYLSVMTTLRNMKPCATVVHSDCEPISHWWKQLTKEPNFYTVFQKPPTEVYNFNVTRVHHQADVARLDILLRWGGIYLDDTVLVIRSFDDLRNHSTVLPFQEHGILNNGVIVAAPNASFLQLWREESYSDYRGNAWAFNSCRYPWILWKKYPDCDLHVEMESFLPKWDGWEEVFFGHYPWKKNLGIHLYTNKLKRLRGKRNYPDDVLKMDSTFGEIARMTLYNSDEMALRNIRNKIVLRS